MFLPRFLFLTFAAACAGGIACPPNAIGAEVGLNFDSPGVLNLSLRPSHRVGKKLALEPLAPSEAAEILAARKVEADPNLLDDVMQKFDCGKQGEDCEAKRIAASGGAVQRRGGRLEISSEAGPPLWFGNVDSRTPKQRDRDAFLFTYWGRLQGSGYHRVQEEFSEDSPGSFLVNARNGKVAFVHQYDDVVVVAPGGAHLVAVNYLNLPFVVRVAARGMRRRTSPRYTRP
jgi:hypothetical protein